MPEPTLPLDILTRIADDLLAYRNERNSNIIKYGDMDQDLRQAQAAAAALASSGSRVLRDRITPMLYQSPRFWTTHEIEEVNHHFKACVSLCARLRSLIVPFAAGDEIRAKVAFRSSLIELGLVAVNNMNDGFLYMGSLSTYMSAGVNTGRLSARIKHLSLQNYSYYPEQEHSRHIQPLSLTLQSLSLYQGNLSKRSLDGLLATSRDSLTRLSIDFGGHYPGGHITTDEFKSSILSLVRLQHLTILTDGFRIHQSNSGDLYTAGLIDELAPQLLHLQSLEFDENLATTALFDSMPATIKVLRILHPTHIHPTDLPLLAAQAVRRPHLPLRRVVAIWKEEDRANWRRVGGATTDLLAVQGITMRSFTDWYVRETLSFASSSPHLRRRCLRYPNNH
ncbi:hypothetical protein GGG16DRAFT_55776 [Schizophyllum commune]